MNAENPEHRFRYGDDDERRIRIPESADWGERRNQYVSGRDMNVEKTDRQKDDQRRGEHIGYNPGMNDAPRENTRPRHKQGDDDR